MSPSGVSRINLRCDVESEGDDELVGTAFGPRACLGACFVLPICAVVIVNVLLDGESKGACAMVKRCYLANFTKKLDFSGLDALWSGRQLHRRMQM